MNISHMITYFCKNMAKKLLPSKLYNKIKSLYFSFFKFKYAKGNTFTNKKRRYPFGINLFIHNTKNSGGILALLLQEALTVSKIPFRVIDLDNPEDFNAKEKKLPLYNINLVVLHAASHTKYRLQLFNINFKHHYNIGYWAWELDEVPSEFCGGLELFSEFWTLSTFCSTGLSKKTVTPVLTIPPHILAENKVIQKNREYFNIPDDLFLFTFVFDCTSFVERKNPKAVVEAFIKTSHKLKSIGLIIKYIYPESADSYIKEIKCMLAQCNNIFFFDEFMSDQELKALLKISDAFVSLHRAEGFGLLPLEAMAMGVPVIATEWSGNMEYMNHKNTALVGCTMTPVNGNYVGSTYGDGLMWAEPDIDEAAEYMYRMVTDTNWRNSLILNGLNTAKQNTTNKMGKLISDRLEFLGLKI